MASYTVVTYLTDSLKVTETDSLQEWVIKIPYLTMEAVGSDVNMFWHTYETDRDRSFLSVNYADFTTFTAADAADAIADITAIARALSVGDLQEVTDNGFVTTNSIHLTGGSNTYQIDDGAANTVGLGVETQSASGGIMTLPDLNGDVDIIVGQTLPQTLSNKYIYSDGSTSGFMSTANHKYSIGFSGLTSADRRINLPVISVTDEFVLKDLTQTLTNKTLTSPIIITDITIPNTGLHLLDTNASHDLIIAPGSNLTADRTLTVTTGDTNMILDVTAVTDGYVLTYDTGTNSWRGEAASGGGANTALSNLAAVSINTSLLAQTGVDLGSTTNPFRELYLFGTGTYGTDYHKFTGNATGGRTLTLPDVTDTIAVLGLAQTFTGANTHSGLNAVLVSSSGLTVRNPANTFSYTITAAAIAANRILNLPLITATDTISVLGLAQTYSADKTFSSKALINGGSGNTLVVDTSVLVVDATNNTVGIGTASPGSTTGLNMVHTMSTGAAVVNCAYFQITGSGSAAGGAKRAFNVEFNSGYTGGQQTVSLQFSNANAGTGANNFFDGNYVGNLGMQGFANGTTTGTNVGVMAYARKGSRNIGLFGAADDTKSGATNVGVGGIAYDPTGSGPYAGGVFNINTVFGTTITVATCALLADNGNVAAPIAIFRDGGTEKLRVDDGGHLQFADAVNIVTNGTTGTKIGTATSNKIGFWNVTPVIQPAAAAQAALAAYTSGAFGLDSNANMQAMYDLVMAMRTALVNTGIMKGAA